MPCETRTIFSLSSCVVRIALLGAMLLCASRLPGQETAPKRGTVKGTVSLVNASQEPSTSEGLLLELKPLAEGAASGGRFRAIHDDTPRRRWSVHHPKYFSKVSQAHAENRGEGTGRAALG